MFNVEVYVGEFLSTSTYILPTYKIVSTDIILPVIYYLHISKPCTRRVIQ